MSKLDRYFLKPFCAYTQTINMKFSQLTISSAWYPLHCRVSLVFVALLMMLFSVPGFGQNTTASLPIVPSTTAASAASLTNYKITANDLLEVEVFGVDDLKRTVRVNMAGGITIPLVGMIQVGGLSATEAEALIAARYKDSYLQNPQVSVFIKEFTTQRITIDGAVNKPGIYPLSGQITLLRALALAGGGAQLANLEEVLLFRSNGTANAQEVLKYDVKKIRNGEMQDPPLRGDDLIVVNRNGAREIMKDSIFRDVLDFLNPFSVLAK
jgi:polysaccharide biosynthesis/export protein